ncbi:MULTISPECIES: DUF6934 family protein [Flavobacterium]|jgi:hypothetical protein|uniref:Uncharacterized protein n=1 Tax=Flavobacterium pectinovorum TaxID=29533 RepID=A0AB36P4E1_9FLAO|nr:MULTISPECIES: hypothetical protein [Flavobacterium]KIQ22243.1 hypothetical protein RT99_08630 [Flavobacterium sp. MEB061]OXB06799.1 hypothetical protein B0A72_04820 [Flavobacterium pectinovorum]SHL46753.1 hypothetical protein SAMN05444387_0676 [Flavobacterium pectinovorum]
MKHLKYELYRNTETTIFEFKSIGPNGEITKVIIFNATQSKEIYNLAFGDLIYDEVHKRYILDDSIITNNGDRNKILATVASSVYIFTEKYPKKMVFFKGSTLARTRLYRRALSINLEELSETFIIFGSIKNEFGNVNSVPFKSNGDFFGFIIKRKEL